MAYLHSRGVIHRDVKSSNMLVASDFTVKIGDFGFSRIKADNHTMTMCGTVAWTAPEIFQGSLYSEKADVYSYGIILWEIIFRKKPWDGMHSMRVTNYVSDGKRPPLTDMRTDTPQDIVSLMQTCWGQDPATRPTFTQIIQTLTSWALQLPQFFRWQGCAFFLPLCGFSWRLLYHISCK